MYGGAFDSISFDRQNDRKNVTAELPIYYDLRWRIRAYGTERFIGGGGV